MKIETLYSVDKESCGSIYSATLTHVGYFQSRLNAEVCAQKNGEYGRPANITEEDFVIRSGEYYRLSRKAIPKYLIKDL